MFSTEAVLSHLEVAAEHNLGGALPRVPVRGVSILHQCAEELVVVEAAVTICVLSEQTLHALATQLSSLVALRESYRG